MPAEIGLLVDIDGVVTDEFGVIDDDVVGALTELAELGCGLAFITGRSRQWVNHHLLPRLVSPQGLPRRQRGARVVLAAEMGAERTAGLRAGPWDTDGRFAVSAPLRRDLLALTGEPRYRGLLTWDDSKTITATAEAVHIRGDHAHRARTLPALRSWRAEAQRLLGADYGVHQSTYAVDVLRPGLTKELGARFALTQFSTRGAPSAVLVLGDGPSDVAMATAAHAHGIADIRFIWLGTGPPPTVPVAQVITPDHPHSKGTLSVLLSVLDAIKSPPRTAAPADEARW